MSAVVFIFLLLAFFLLPSLRTDLLFDLEPGGHFAGVLAYLDHVQLRLQLVQCLVIKATSTLGDSAESVCIWVIAAHQEDGHHASCRQGQGSSAYYKISKQ